MFYYEWKTLSGVGKLFENRFEQVRIKFEILINLAIVLKLLHWLLKWLLKTRQFLKCNQFFVPFLFACNVISH